MQLLTLTALLFLSLAASAEEVKNYSIYGRDDREEIIDARVQALAKGVVVAIPTQFTWKLPLVSPRSVQERFKVCPFDRFATQPSIGSCTGIHVGDGLVLTAAHCIKNTLDCEKFQWAFDYRSDVVGVEVKDFKLDQIYQCKKIVARDAKNDIALVQLDSAARKQGGLKINWSAVATEEVFAIGSPLGMPLKFSGYAQLSQVEGAYGMASLDVFHGNSGSPVMNKYQQIIGLLVSGGEDFTTTESGCRESLVYAEGESHETIFMLSALPEPFKKLIRRAGRKLK